MNKTIIQLNATNYTYQNYKDIPEYVHLSLANDSRDTFVYTYEGPLKGEMSQDFEEKGEFISVLIYQNFNLPIFLI